MFMQIEVFCCCVGWQLINIKYTRPGPTTQIAKHFAIPAGFVVIERVSHAEHRDLPFHSIGIINASCYGQKAEGCGWGIFTQLIFSSPNSPADVHEWPLQRLA